VTSLWAEDVTVGWSSSRVLTDSLSRADIARYAGASGDVNLVHVDEPYAQQAGHPAVIAHGMLTMGLTGSFLTSLVGHDSLVRFGGRFVAPVLAGDRLSCTATVGELLRGRPTREVVLQLRTVSGEDTVVFKGQALAREHDAPRLL
jgi:peroxisomal enoyl-CoA hydratase 2